MNSLKLRDGEGEIFTTGLKFVSNSQTKLLGHIYSCDLCHEKLHTFGSLKKHLLSHFGCYKMISQESHQKALECSICGKLFFNKTKLQSHMLQYHQDITYFPCDVCGLVFSHSHALVWHLIQHIDGSADSRCFIQTSVDVLNGKQRESHILALGQNSRISFKCEDCQVCFNSFGLLASHLLVHIGALSYTCHMCDATRSTRADLIRHLETHFWNMRRGFAFKCGKCSCRFNTSQSLMIHNLWHQESRFLYCTRCEAEFPNMNELVSHMKVHIGIPDYGYNCYICGKPFPKETAMLTHYASTHVNCKPGECVICGRVYNRSRNSCYLAYHYQEHSGIFTPVYCEVCGASCKNILYLYSHKTKHRTCPICKKQVRNMTEHKKIHTDERPFLCSECGKSFRIKHQLRDHMRIHSGERPFQCQTCKQRFKVLSHLRQHMGTAVCEQNAGKMTII